MAKFYIIENNEEKEAMKIIDDIMDEAGDEFDDVEELRDAMIEIAGQYFIYWSDADDFINSIYSCTAQGVFDMMDEIDGWSLQISNACDLCNEYLIYIISGLEIEMEDDEEE